MTTDTYIDMHTVHTEAKAYTAIGFWDGNEIAIAGIVAGDHAVFGGDHLSEEGPWADGFTVEPGQTITEVLGALKADYEREYEHGEYEDDEDEGNDLAFESDGEVNDVHDG